jgi:hypothetical protein
LNVIHLHQCDGVPDYARRAARELLLRLEEQIEIRHEVYVRLVAAVLYPTTDGSEVLGEFMPDGECARIWVCGLRCKDTGASEWQAALYDTLAHEFVHYERWRDGKDHSTERGVKVRTRSLLKKMGL